MENDSALKELSDQFAKLDTMSGAKLHETLVTSILAGNMFDWGAAEAVRLMENGSFGLEEALSQIQSKLLFFLFFNLFLMLCILI